MLEDLTYRIAEEGDTPGLIRLWERNSDWGSLSREECKRFYVDTPYGPSITPVAIDAEGEIAGQIKFVPCLVAVEGKVHKALNMHAMILRKDLRTPWALTPQHPLARLYNTGIQAATAMGYSIVYSLPVYAWRLLFRWLGTFSAAEYQCVTLPLRPATSTAPPPTVNTISSIALEFGSEYTSLWNNARASMPITCGLVREPARLQHTVNTGGHFTVEVREQNTASLVGYCTIEQGQGLLVDILARTPPELALVIDETVRLLQSGPDPTLVHHQLKDLRAMETPFLQAVLNSLGFSRVNYKFSFVCTSLDPSLPLERISAEKWYVMPGG